MTGMGLRNLQKGGSYLSTLLYSGVRKSASSPFSIFSKMAEDSSLKREGRPRWDSCRVEPKRLLENRIWRQVRYTRWVLLNKK